MNSVDSQQGDGGALLEGSGLTIAKTANMQEVSYR